MAVGLAFVGYRKLKGHRALGRGELTWWGSGRSAAAAAGGGLEEDGSRGAAYRETGKGYTQDTCAPDIPLVNLSQTAAKRIAAVYLSVLSFTLSLSSSFLSVFVRLWALHHMVAGDP